MTITSVTRLTDVTIVERPIGPVYRAVMSIADLYRSIDGGTVRYAPRYQRGLKIRDDEEIPRGLLLSITDKELQLNPKRAQQMAVKYLKKQLYTSHVTWNARNYSDAPPLSYDEEDKSLQIETDITVPDTGHRHLAYYLLGRWSDHPKEVPARVDVFGSPVSREEILQLLDDFEPEDEFVFVEIFNLDADEEGYLYDEFNDEAKKPGTAVAMELNPRKTPTRRFVYDLMDVSEIFDRREVEVRSNTIGSKSRKLTTNATLEQAAASMTSRRDLVELERDRGAWNDLIAFVDAFFGEWGAHFPAFLPDATADDRHALRERSFALSNIMFHPLLRMTFDFWKGHHHADRDWREQDDWKQAIAAMAGEITTTDPKTDKEVTKPVMDRVNPDWVGRVLIRRVHPQTGDELPPSLSSTRQTREAAYRYLREVAGLDAKSRATEEPAIKAAA